MLIISLIHASFLKKRFFAEIRGSPDWKKCFLRGVRTAALTLEIEAQDWWLPCSTHDHELRNYKGSFLVSEVSTLL